MITTEITVMWNIACVRYHKPSVRASYDYHYKHQEVSLSPATVEYSALTEHWPGFGCPNSAVSKHKVLCGQGAVHMPVFEPKSYQRQMILFKKSLNHQGP